METRAAATFPARFSLQAASFLRWDRFHLTNPYASCTVEMPASVRSEGVRDHSCCHAESSRIERSASPESPNKSKEGEFTRICNLLRLNVSNGGGPSQADGNNYLCSRMGIPARFRPERGCGDCYLFSMKGGQL